MIKSAAFILALAPALAGAQSVTSAVAIPSGNVPVDRIVAVIGDQPLLWSEVLSAVNQRRAQGLAVPTDSAGQIGVARTVLNDLIDEELLVQKAKQLKLEASEVEIGASADRQLKSVREQFKSDEEYRAELRRAGFGSPEDYRKTLIDQYRRQSLQQKAFAELRKKAKPVAISDSEIGAAYEKSKNSLQKRPALVSFRQIIITPKPSTEAKARAKAKAESLLVEIRKGGDFEQIAKRESMDPGTKALGGDLGWNRRGSGLVPEFERVMFALRPGDISGVVETAFGYHLIRVDRVQSAEVKAHHILIAPVIDANDVERALNEADTVAAQWRRGVNYDSLVAKHHDPAEEKGILQPYPADSLPQSYKTALAGATPGKITQPFQLANPRGNPKFTVMQILTLTAPGQYVEAEVRDQIRAQLADERAIR
ncbi:MAG: peptidylprolyl isomerase, partial [Gemmatimonadaceae bacterium]|nr:peptidylprolyl isomerase [Gemmatimonadaceae bacterium]